MFVRAWVRSPQTAFFGLLIKNLRLKIKFKNKTKQNRKKIKLRMQIKTQDLGKFFCILKMRGPGIEPGSTAWKAAMLTITPATRLKEYRGVSLRVIFIFFVVFFFSDGKLFFVCVAKRGITTLNAYTGRAVKSENRG